MMIPCLCSFLFTVPSSPSAEPLINKKRTRTLSRKESGLSTNCMVEHCQQQSNLTDQRLIYSNCQSLQVN